MADFTDPFAGLKDRESRKVGSFAGTQYGGQTFIGGTGGAASAGTGPNLATSIEQMLQLRGLGYTADQATRAVTGAGAAGQDVANTGLIQTRSGLLPASTAADIGLTTSQAAYQGAQASAYPALARSIAAQNYGSAAAGYGSGAFSTANAGHVNRLGTGLSDDVGANVTSADELVRAQRIGQGFRFSADDPLLSGSHAKGLTKVPGKGSGKVDTKVATVAPGEAIMNKGAAETMGRGLIAALNAHGAAKMGLA